MKRLIIASALFLIGSFTFGQKRIGDPSYSPRNYKHANKVAVARQLKLDQSMQLASVWTMSNAEHKHRYNHSGIVLKGTIKTLKVNSSRRGYKHPLGL